MTLAARVFVVALALVPLTAGTAAANPPSSVSQYIEPTPSAGGKAPGNRTAPLSRVSASALGAASRSVASALKEVATSTALGAPNASLSVPKSARISPNDSSFTGSLKEMGSSILGSGGSGIGLLAGLTVIAAAVALTARKKNRPSS